MSEREEFWLCIGTFVCVTIFFTALVWVVHIPNKHEEDTYEIKYEQPEMLCDEVPYKLLDDPKPEIEIRAEMTTQMQKVETTEVKEPQMTFIGVYELTAYEWTGNRCANGNYPTCDYTVACNSLPLGTRIFIEGMGTYVVEDRGGMADSVIDIYMGDYDTCIQFGRRSANVYVYEDE